MKTPDPMKIDLLYFSGCPSWKLAYEFLNEIISEKQLAINVDCKLINSNEEAELNYFPGSPTIRVNGNDLFPIEQSDYRLRCRIYITPDGFVGSPSKEMIEERLNSVLNSRK